MSKEFPRPLYLRMRRIHELERAADDQRERLRLHTAGLMASVHGGGLWREAASGLLNKVTANAGPLGGIVRTLILRLNGAGPKKGKNKFPWLSAVMAGVAAAGFASWWKHRRDGE